MATVEKNAGGKRNSFFSGEDIKLLSKILYFKRIFRIWQNSNSEQGENSDKYRKYFVETFRKQIDSNLSKTQFN